MWTDYNARRIQGKVDGGEVQTIIQFPSPQRAYQIHYDPVTAKLYYLFFDGTQESFQRANLDGSDPENIPTPSVGRFTLNVDSRKLYWSDSPFWNVLHRSELNGTGVESHTYPSGSLLTLEAFGDDLFFGAGGAMLKGIWRADADGSNEQFLHFSGQPLDPAHDPVENKLYWSAYFHGMLRMNLDGTGFEQLFFLGSDGVQVVVDSRARKLYWADPAAKVIRRSNLDGSNVEDFVTASDVGNPNFAIAGLTIVYSLPPILTLSGWGLTAMAVLIVAAGLVLRRRQFNPRERRMCNTLGRTKVFGLFLSGVTAFLGSGGLWASEALAQCDPTQCCPTGATGPDAVSVLTETVGAWGCANGIQAYFVSGGVCNVGTAPLRGNTNLSLNEHAMMTQNLYRLRNNRFEQIGMSWVKHDDWTLGYNSCGSLSCVSASSLGALGVGCNDIYTECRNGLQGYLGPRSQINAATGERPEGAQSYCNPASVMACRLQVQQADLAQTSSTLKYFLEQQFITPDETSVTTRNNNVSYTDATVGNPSLCDEQICGAPKRCTGCPGGVLYPLTVEPAPFCQEPAIHAWKDIDPSVMETDIQVPDDGLFIHAAKATSIGSGWWSYEYAL